MSTARRLALVAAVLLAIAARPGLSTAQAGNDGPISRRGAVKRGGMAMVDHTIRVRQWTRPEYDRLIETGFFHQDDNVELIGGQLMVAAPVVVTDLML